MVTRSPLASRRSVSTFSNPFANPFASLGGKGGGAGGGGYSVFPGPEPAVAAPAPAAPHPAPAPITHTTIPIQQGPYFTPQPNYFTQPSPAPAVQATDPGMMGGGKSSVSS